MEDLVAPARDPHPVARAAGRVPVGRQPAEGRGLAIVPAGAGRHPRLRADAGGRRRLPVRHLRGAALADRRRARPAGQVERPDRARRAVRPGARDVAGPDHRGDPRRRARRAADRRGDRPRTRAVAGRTVAARRGHAQGARRSGARRELTRSNAARLAVRKVLRDARDKNKWRKIVRFRLWMPVALQILLIVGVVLWYTSSRFPGFINADERHEHPAPGRAAGGRGDGADPRAARRLPRPVGRRDGDASGS